MNEKKNFSFGMNVTTLRPLAQLNVAIISWLLLGAA
jgi:hypothetical protein